MVNFKPGEYMTKMFFLFVSYRHGNKCAGVIAGVANNSLCGVGLAYNVKIAGMRMKAVSIDKLPRKTFNYIITSKGSRSFTGNSQMTKLLTLFIF